ncbi:MAG: hypothetical protein KZQ99_14330 [Candidatus Thiodiazotropha sp. (ex Dulcina madagascariensis)]|nr:hypothetical protein [Candidatus Thiodiazotropha sp. (ex Dulcina madagascariensis)]
MKTEAYGVVVGLFFVDEVTLNTLRTASNEDILSGIRGFLDITISGREAMAKDRHDTETVDMFTGKSGREEKKKPKKTI